jgi:hypothetical protein
MATGVRGYSQGYIADQTQLLQDIRDGLSMYNEQIDPLIGLYCEPTVRETLRVSQMSLTTEIEADGGTPNDQRAVFRLLKTRFGSYVRRTTWTQQGMEDALPGDIDATVRQQIIADREHLATLFFSACMTSHGTANTIGTASLVGFYNGETDVPDFESSSFNGTSQVHYIGTANATLGRDNVSTMQQLIQNKGYGRTAGGLTIFINTAQTDDVMNIQDPGSGVVTGTPERVKAIDNGVWGQGVMVNGCRVVVNNNVPSGYVLMLASDVKPLSFCEHVDPSVRGLMIAPGPNNTYPLVNATFRRRFGFAVQHMGAGAVLRLGNATWASPTFRFTAANR